MTDQSQISYGTYTHNCNKKQVFNVCTLIEGGGGVTPIRGMVYMCLPGLWVMFCEFCLGYGSALRRFAAVMDKC